MKNLILKDRKEAEKILPIYQKEGYLIIEGVNTFYIYDSSGRLKKRIKWNE